MSFHGYDTVSSNKREPVDGRGFAALYSTIAAVIVYPMGPEFDGVFVRRISS